MESSFERGFTLVNWLILLGLCFCSANYRFGLLFLVDSLWQGLRTSVLSFLCVASAGSCALWSVISSYLTTKHLVLPKWPPAPSSSEWLRAGIALASLARDSQGFESLSVVWKLLVRSCVAGVCLCAFWCVRLCVSVLLPVFLQFFLAKIAQPVGLIPTVPLKMKRYLKWKQHPLYFSLSHTLLSLH